MRATPTDSTRAVALLLGAFLSLMIALSAILEAVLR